MNGVSWAYRSCSMAACASHPAPVDEYIRTYAQMGKVLLCSRWVSEDCARIGRPTDDDLGDGVSLAGLSALLEHSEGRTVFTF